MCASLPLQKHRCQCLNISPGCTCLRGGNWYILLISWASCDILLFRTKAPVLIAFEDMTVFQGACIYASRGYFIIFTHRVDAYFRP